MESSPVEKDVVIAMLGAAAALAGLVLVFLGIVIATIQSFPPDTPPTVLTPYRMSTAFILGTFFISLASVCFSLIWLVVGSGETLYHACLGAFLFQLVVLAIVSGVVAWQLVFKG